MITAKLVKDVYFAQRSPCRHLLTRRQDISTRLFARQGSGYSSTRRLSVFSEFSKQVKGQINKNPEFQKSVEELKVRVSALKDDLKERTMRTSKRLSKHAGDAWTEAEVAANRVSASMKEKIQTAKWKQTIWNRKKQSRESSTAETDSSSTLLRSLRTVIMSSASQMFSEGKVVDFARKGVDAVRGELQGIPRKKHIRQGGPPGPATEKASGTDVVVVSLQHSVWSQKWQAFKDKVQAHPLYKRISGYSEPVVVKGHELAEDMRERWETSDNPVVHKIQDLNESVFGETHAALSFKEIRRRDPSFSLPEFVAEVQEVVRPVLSAYVKGDTETLKKYCSLEVIQRCTAERRTYEGQGVFFDDKILHVSEVEVRETKMMGDVPIIILAFQTQQVYCARDRHGLIKEGGKDTIHTVYYAWAMQQQQSEVDGCVWLLREMQRLGVQALI